MLVKIRMQGIVLIGLAVLLLTACGQKRALYLPAEPETNKAATEQTEPAAQSESRPN